MTVLTPVAKMQFFDVTGAPLVGGLLYTYSAGTTTPQVTYTDSTGATANTNPVVLDARGEANIWLGASTYKFRLCSADNTEFWTVDNISAPTSALSPVLSGNVTIDSSTSGPALKITQTSTGPSLRIQDPINAGNAFVLVDSTGLVGINTQSPATALDVNGGVIQLSSSGTSRTTISADASNSTINSPGTRGLLLATGGTTRVTISSAGVVTFSGATVFSGGATITGNVAVTGTLSSTSTLTVSAGGASITGGLTVPSGGAAITGNSTVTGTLNATSTLTAQNGLTVSTGGASITGNSTVTGTLTATSTLTAQNGLTVSTGGAGITGLLTANSGVNVTGTVTATTFTGAWTNLPSGTVMLFVQTAAPTGWTKSTTHNNKALRVVSGSVSSGGSVAFTSAFASQAVTGTNDPYTLQTADIPSHTHTATVTDSGHFHNYDKVSGTAQAVGGSGSSYFTGTASTATDTKTTGITVANSLTGGGGGHTHTFNGTAINLAVQYVDVIIATKD